MLCYFVMEALIWTHKMVRNRVLGKAGNAKTCNIAWLFPLVVAMRA